MTLLLLVAFALIPFISAEFGYNNPDLPKLNSEEVIVSFDNASAEVNNSQFLQGFTPVEFWQTVNIQTGLSGDKNGSYNIGTTGSINANYFIADTNLTSPIGDTNNGLINLQWLTNTSKPLMAWLNETGNEKIWLAGHYLLSEGNVHQHFSIETSNTSGQLNTKFEVPFDCDNNLDCRISTHDADFDIGGEGYLFLDGGKIGIGERPTATSPALIIKDGNVIQNSTGTVSYRISRGGTSNYASFVFSTTDSDKWSLGLRNDGTNNFFLRDNINGRNLIIANTSGVLTFPENVIAKKNISADTYIFKDAGNFLTADISDNANLQCIQDIKLTTWSGVEQTITIGKTTFTNNLGLFDFGDDSILTSENISDGVLTISDGKITNLDSISDGTAFWLLNNLENFGDIEALSSISGGDIVISDGQIISGSGLISFGNENLTGTGNLSIDNIKIGSGDDVTRVFVTGSGTGVGVKIDLRNIGGQDTGISFMEAGTGDFGTAGNYGFRTGLDGGTNEYYIESGNQGTVTRRIEIGRDTGMVFIKNGMQVNSASGGTVYDDFRVSGDTLVNALYVNSSSGRTAIGGGTTSPEARLHVSQASILNAHYDSQSATIVEALEGRLQFVAEDSGTQASAFILTSVPASGNNLHWVMRQAGPGYTKPNAFEIGFNTSSETRMNILSDFEPDLRIETDGRMTIFNDTEVKGNLNVTGNFTGNQIYGEMWMNNESTNGNENQIPLQNVWYNLTGFNQTIMSGQSLNGFGYVGGEQPHLIAQVSGKYKADYSVSFELSSGTNDEFEMIISINDIPQNNTEIHRKIASSGDLGNAGSSGFIDLIFGDKITLQVKNKDASDNIGVHSANVNLLRIGN